MACSACMTHTNPQPCCAPPARHFGNPESGEWRPLGYELVQVTSPPWWQTGLGFFFFFGVAPQIANKDIRTIVKVGSAALPTTSWARYYRYRTEGE